MPEMIPRTRNRSANGQRLSLSDHAYLVIRDRILRGEIPLGGALSRRKLAAQLDMSLLPVAEALQQLENDGLVESKPRVGTRVCMPAANDIRERYEVREALESQAARLFAGKASLKDKLELVKGADRLDAMFNRCFDTGEKDRDFLYAVHSYHSEFHLRIAQSTGCRALQEAIERNHVLVFNWLFDVAAERPRLPPQFHRDLADALIKGDPELADTAMRAHVRYGIDRVVAGVSAKVEPASSMRRVRTATTE